MEIDDYPQAFHRERWHNRLDVVRKEGWRGLTNNEDYENALIEGLEMCITNSKERLITVVWKGTDS